MKLNKINELSVNLCRICMAIDGVILLTEEIDDTCVSDMIKQVFDISIIISASCSSTICQECFNKVQISCELRKVISQAEEKWKGFCDSLLLQESEQDTQNQLQHEPALANIEREESHINRSIRKGYSCKKCSKIVFSTTALKTHMTTHTGEKPFECNVCNKLFSNSGSLYSHKQIHTDNKTFICEICSKQFVSASYLKQHMRTHAPDAEREIKCDKCDKIFRTKRFYLMHLKKHDGIRDISCSNCGKLFYHKRDLSRHVRTIHLEIKKFKCSVCSRAFSNSGNLAAHKRVHTGEKPYECKYCDARFNQSTPLARHTTNHIDKGHRLKFTEVLT